MLLWLAGKRRSDTLLAALPIPEPRLWLAEAPLRYTTKGSAQYAWEAVVIREAPLRYTQAPVNISLAFRCGWSGSAAQIH